MEKAVFGAGCFWHVEEVFRTCKGVFKTEVGFMGGTLKNPSYEQVCTERTGYAEVVLVEYDPAVVSYAKLLGVFWKGHDPTTLNRQGADVGSQYRSVIFYYTEEQKKQALISLKEEQKKYAQKIVTEIIWASVFYKAEEYHQQYLAKKGLKTCPV